MEKQSAKWIEFCRLYKQLTEAIDMSSKKKVSPKRVRAKVDVAQAVESLEEDGLELPPAISSMSEKVVRVRRN